MNSHAKQDVASLPLLEVRDLHVAFDMQGGLVQAVSGISFNIKPGKVVAVVGESGSGKSVTAQAILRILPRNGRITSGSILFRDPATPGDETDIASFPQKHPYLRQLRGARISMIFQEPMTALSPLHTIGDQIEEALTLHRKVTDEEARRETEEVLSLVGFPQPERGYTMYPFELSGGLRQRAVIAMALICNPALVIADEPTTALDVTVQAQILGLIKDLQAKFEMAVLLITHDLGVVANMADEVVVVYHGRVMEAGSVEAIFKNPQHPYLKALLAAVPHFKTGKQHRLVSLRDDDNRDAIGQLAPRFRERIGEADANQQKIHLKVCDLRKEFIIRSGSLIGGGEENRIVAVDNVSFEIERGECLGLVGESGSGKTTVSKLIMRALAADAGTVELIGKDRAMDVLGLEGGALQDFRRRVQMIFQDPFSSLNPRMTVNNILREPYEIHDLYSREERQDQIVDLMKIVGLDPRYLNRYPHSFSGGQRQRIGIARALALHPELMVCDEPVSALDVSVQAQILNLLNDLREELGLTSLFISHNLAVVHYVAKRIAVMCQGKLVEIASRDQLFENPRHPYTKALLASVPFPDLDRLLDFENAKFEASSKVDWGGTFKVSQTGRLIQIEVDKGHFVLANENTQARELIA